MMDSLARASKCDAEEILALYRSAAAFGRARQSSDWDESYPTMENIRSDLAARGLFVLRQEGRILAAISAVPPTDLDALEEYRIPWFPARAVEICRFCLSPELQGTGMAPKVLAELFAILRGEGVEAVRYLCAKANPVAYHLYKGLKHRELGEARWHDTDFYCFECLL